MPGYSNPNMRTVAELVGGRRWCIYQTLRYLFDRTKPFERHPIID